MTTKKPSRKRLATALAALALGVLSVGAPAASAAPAPTPASLANLTTAMQAYQSTGLKPVSLSNGVYALPLPAGTTALPLPQGTAIATAKTPLAWTTGWGANDLPGLSDSGGCGYATGNDDQGGTAGTANVTCQGTGLIFVGPSVGQIASVVGPTIISPGFVGQVAVANGNAAID